jgi:hypothetical protein
MQIQFSFAPEADVVQQVRNVRFAPEAEVAVIKSVDIAGCREQ